jgi:hypothetical protein
MVVPSPSEWLASNAGHVYRASDEQLRVLIQDASIVCRDNDLRSFRTGIDDV